MIMVILAQNGSVIHSIGALTRWSFSSIVFTRPLPENKYLNTTEYATSEVTQGRKIAVRKNPLNLSLLSFSSTEINSARMIISGT